MNRKTICLNLALVMVSLCIALILGEVILRFTFPQSLGVWRQTRDGLILLRPSFDGYSHAFQTRVKTNSLGFRDVEHELVADTKTYRILLLGDSFMEALQVEFEESFPHLLEQELNKLLRCHVEVINASVSGWGTDDEVTYFSRRGRELRPDLVLYAFTLHNDVSDNLEERYHRRQRNKLHPKPVTNSSFPRHLSLEIRSYLISHSHLYQLAYKSYKSLGAVKAGKRVTSHVVELMRVDPGSMAENGWSVTKQLLAEAKRISQIDGAKLVVFAIPLIYQVDSEAYENLLVKYGLRKGELDPNKPGSMLRRILHEEDITRIDLLSEFLKYSNVPGSDVLYLPSDGHWSRAGHRVAALALSRQLSEIIRNSKSTKLKCR